MKVLVSLIAALLIPVGGSLLAQENATSGHCSGIYKSNMAPLTTYCFVFVSARQSEYPSNTPREPPTPTDAEGSAFQKTYSIATYFMTYADFRLALGRIQAGLAAVNGTESVRRSREQLIIGAEDQERGRVSVFNFDNASLTRLIAAPSADFYYNFESPEGVIKSVEIAYNHVTTGRPNELTYTGIRISSSNSEKMGEMSAIIRDAFSPYRSQLASALFLLSLCIYFVEIVFGIFPGYYFMIIVTISLVFEPRKWRKHAAFGGVFVLYALLLGNSLYQYANFPVVVPLQGSWTMTIAWISLAGCLAAFVPMALVFFNYVDTLNDE